MKHSRVIDTYECELLSHIPQRAQPTNEVRQLRHRLETFSWVATLGVDRLYKPVYHAVEQSFDGRYEAALFRNLEVDFGYPDLGPLGLDYLSIQVLRNRFATPTLPLAVQLRGLREHFANTSNGDTYFVVDAFHAVYDALLLDLARRLQFVVLPVAVWTFERHDDYFAEEWDFREQHFGPTLINGTVRVT